MKRELLAYSVYAMFVNKRQKTPQPRRADTVRHGNPANIGKSAPSFGIDSSSKNLNNVTSSQGESKKPLDWDDISLSSEDSKSFERFLKKEPSENGKTSKFEKRTNENKIQGSYERPKTSRGASESIPKPQMSSSSALNRLALLEAKIKNRQGVHSQNKVSLSGSDFDLDMSSDLEVKREIGKPNVKLREKLEQITRRKESKKGQNIFLTLDDESDDSTARKRYYKADVATEHSDVSDSQDSVNANEQRRKRGELNFIKTDQEIMKVHGSTDFDESEVSLQTYMRSFDKEKDSRKSGSSKRVTFASDLVRSSDLGQSLDEYMPPSDGSDEPSSLDEVIPSRLHNIMSLDDLMPSEDLKFDTKDDERPSSALGFVGLHSVDELLPAGNDVRSSSEYVPSMSEEIQEASVRSSNDSFSDGPANILQNLHSIDDLQETDSEPKITSTPLKSIPEAKNIFKVQSTVDSESDEIHSESHIYTEDFQSDDDTLKETESITHDVSEASRSLSSVPEEDSRGSRVHSSSYSTSSMRTSVSSSSSTITSARTPSPVRRKPKKKVESTQVQTDIAAGAWLPGSVYADTGSFKPSRLIDNEALDILTSYNPANLAIQDLLRQQVALTRDFVTRSRRLHDLAVTTIPCDYVYGEVNREGLERLKKIWYTEDESTVSAT